MFPKVAVFFVLVATVSGLSLHNNEEFTDSLAPSFSHQHQFSSLLTPEKCNRNDRTRKICKILLRSAKFRKKFLRIPRKISEVTVPTYQQEYEQKNDRNRSNADKRSLEIETNEVIEIDENEPQVEDFLPQIHQYPVLTNPRRRFFYPRVPQFRHLRPFKMKRFRNMLWPRVIQARNTLAEMPLALAGIPLLWTTGLALLLKSHVKKPNEEEELVQFSTNIEPPPPPKLSPNPMMGGKKNATKLDRLKLAKDAISLTAESLALASNKMDLINSVATALKPVSFANFLTANRLNINSTLLSSIQNLKGGGRTENATSDLMTEFVNTITQQLIRNVTFNLG